MKWSEVIEHPEFKRRSAVEQEQTRDQYFREFVAPKFDEQQLPKVREQFDTDTYIRKQDLPQGATPSTAGAGRGDEMPGRGLPTLADRMQQGLADLGSPAPPAAAPAGPRRGGMRAEFKPFVGGDQRQVAPPAPAQRGLSALEIPTPGFTPTPDDLVANSAAPRTRAAMAAPVLQDMAERADDQERAEARNTSAPRKLADVGVAAGGGVVTGFKLLADAVGGAGNPASDVLNSAHQAVQSLRSAAARQDEKQVGAIMKAAEDGGVWDGLGAAARAFGVAPASMIAQGLGTSVPGILAMMLPGVRESTIAALATAGVVGGVQGAGSVKSNIYDAVQAEMLGRGMPADEAKDRARAAQAYLGENTDQIALGTALGVLAGSTGGERFAINTIRSMMGKAALQEGAKGGIKATIKGTLVEGGTEGLQGGQEQLASNVALQREGVNVPTMRGVVASGGLEAMAGMGSGAVMGAADMATSKTAGQEIAGAINQGADAYAKFFKPAPEATAPTAARADSLKRFDEAAAAWGLTPKAASAVREQAGTMPSDEVPGFLARATAALSKRGLFRRPVDEAGLADLDKRLRPPPTETETPDVNQPDVDRVAPELVGASDGGSDPAARSGGTVGSVPDAPGPVVSPAGAPAASSGPDQPVADGRGPDPALTSKRTPEEAIARMAEQDAQDYKETKSRQIAADNAPTFEDRASDDILSDKGTAWASKTLANKRLRGLPNGYRLARVSTGWVIKPETSTENAPFVDTSAAPVQETAESVQVASAQEAAALAQPAPEQSRAPEAAAPAMPTASWVIREKGTGKFIMETFDRKKVDALNIAKYEAVPIQEHLASINRDIKAEAAAPAKSLKDEVSAAYRVADGFFGNDIIAAGIQNDWQRLLDAADARDVSALNALEKKYAADEERDGLGAGTSGAGPGKVKQSRRGAAQIPRFVRAIRDAITREAATPEASNTAAPTQKKAAEYIAEVRAANDEAKKLADAAPRETVTPADDKSVGFNAAGDALYERKDGSRYRLSDGKPAFSGDLAAPVESGAAAPPPAPAKPAKRPPKSFRTTHMVTTTVWAEESGSFEQREIDSETALKAIADDIKALQAFRACIGG